MKSIINGFLAVSSLLLVFSCADYNETDNFTAESGSSYVIPYKDLAPVKSYINRDKYPNMTLGATLKVTDFNKQALEHAAAVTNFDNYAFGSTLMPSSIVNEKGVMNFLFEIKVDPIEDKYVDYTTMDEFTGTSKRGKPVIVKNYDGDNNALKLPKRSMVYIVEGFDLDPTGNYTITFYAQVDKDETVICTFADYKIQEGTGDKATDKKFSIKAGGWKKITIEDLKPSPEITRFKGLGEISPDEFKGFIGKEIRLDQVTLRKEDAVADLMGFYMGKNTAERQNFIIGNLKIEEDAVEN